MENIKRAYHAVSPSTKIISLFLGFLIVMVFVLGINPSMILSDCLVRIGMNGILVLAMLSSISCGTGLNFGLPIGIVCGLVGGVVSMEFNLRGFTGLFAAILVSLPLAVISGYLYGKVLNRVKGSEMMVGNYLAFSIISLFCMIWVFLPVKNPKIVWPMLGYGVRTTLTLDENYTQILDRLWAIELGPDLIIPTGLFIFFIVACVVMALFLRTKVGISMQCCGANLACAKSMGIDTDRMRILGITISTALAAVGIIVYSQSYGFYQLYSAPLMMAFPAIASILIGGATPQKATITHVIIGTILFQSILTIAMPVANKAVSAGSLSETARVIISNGIILYALTKISSEK